MFVGTQQRVTFGNTHYYVDVVFYNKILRSYVLIELKTIKLKKLTHLHIVKIKVLYMYVVRGPARLSF